MNRSDTMTLTNLSKDFENGQTDERMKMLVYLGGRKQYFLNNINNTVAVTNLPSSGYLSYLEKNHRKNDFESVYAVRPLCGVTKLIGEGIAQYEKFLVLVTLCCKQDTKGSVKLYY